MVTLQSYVNLPEGNCNLPGNPGDKSRIKYMQLFHSSAEQDHEDQLSASLSPLNDEWSRPDLSRLKYMGFPEMGIPKTMALEY